MAQQACETEGQIEALDNHLEQVESLVRRSVSDLVTGMPIPPCANRVRFLKAELIRTNLEICRLRRAKPRAMADPAAG